MSPALTMFEVTPDHPVPISPQGGTATVTVLSGDTLYYADTPQVSAAHNQGSVTAGNVQSFTNPAWVRSASLSTVLAQVTAPTIPVGNLPSSVIFATSPQVRMASSYLVPSGGDDSAAMAGALTNFAPFAYPVVMLGPGTFQWNSQVPALLRNTPAKIQGAGRGETTIKLSTTAKRAFDCPYVADYDVYRDIEISDLTVDANNITQTTNNHVVFGNLIGGAYQQRPNFRNVTIRRVNAINVTHTAPGGGGSLQCVAIASGHLASGEATQTTITNILVEDCDFQGGNCGVVAMGATAAGGSVTAGLGVNVFLDRIVVQRVNHDSGVLPSGATAASDAHVQLGGYGFGNSARVIDCTGSSSWDVSVEIDGFQDAKAIRGRFTDTFDGTVLFRNFRAPPDVQSQCCQAIGCTAENINYDPGQGTGGVGFSPHWQVGGDATTAGYIFGYAEFIDCSSRYDNPFALFGATSDANSVGHTVYAHGTRYHGLKIRNLKIGASALAIANSDVQRFPTFVDIAASYSGSVIDIDGIHFDLAGVRSGTANIQWHLVRIQGSNISTFTRNVTADLSGLTGLTTASDTFYWVMYGQTVSTTAQGYLSAVAAAVAPGSNATQNPVFFGSLFGVPANAKSGFPVDRCAFSQLNNTGFDYTIQAAHAGKVLVRDIASQRNAGVGPFQGPTTYTPGASPDVFSNADVHAPFPVIAHIQGGTVSKIEYSEDNVTFYDVGSTAGRFYVNAGHFLRVTYTVAPALYLKFRVLG